MSDLKTRIENICQSELDGEPAAIPVGLRARFKKVTCLTSSMRRFCRESGFGYKYKHSDLFSLVQEFGVVSFDNALIAGSQNLKLSGMGGQGLILQDPFHRDPFDNITLLFKDESQARETPTYYTTAEEVKKAIAALDKSCFSQEIADALKSMMTSEYRFDVTGEELVVREIVQKRIPDFTGQIFSLIPDDKKFLKDWSSCKDEVVLHSNAVNGIVHARPAGTEELNVLRGMSVAP